MTTDSAFTKASSVSQRSPGLWDGSIAPGWDILGNTNGGYVLALLGNAMRNEAGRQDPLSITAHFLAPTRPGLVEIRTEVLKQGRTASTVAATAFAEDKPLVSALGSFGEVVQGAQSLVSLAGPPDLPPVEECFSLFRAPETPDSVPFPPAFMGKVDLRLHPQDAGFAEGKPSGQPQMRSWFQLPGSESIDSLALLLAADALPPTTFNSGLPVAWTPTLELTVHVRAIPVPGWLRIDAQTRFISDGRLEVDALIWDEADHLVAQSRQLQLLPLEAQ